MIQQEITITLRNGMHLRPATLFKKKVNIYQSTVRVIYDGNEALGNSVLSILKLGIQKGSKVILTVEGPDEQEAFRELARVLQESGKEFQEFENKGEREVDYE